MFKLPIVCTFFFLLPSSLFSIDSTTCRISTITINRHPVFDTVANPANNPMIEMTNRSYRIANWFNSYTRADVIRKELLFKEGDVYDPEIVQETARNLRNVSVIGDVSIIPEKQADSTVAITVTTREKWTKLLELSYQQDGGVREATVSIKDNNFLGLVQSIGVGYNYNSDRNNVHGYNLSYSDQRTFGTRWSTALKFTDTEDQKVLSAIFHRPFFAEKERWSAGSVLAGCPWVRARYWDPDGDSLTETFQEEQEVAGWFMRAFGNKHKLYTGLAFSWTYKDPVVYVYDNLDLISASLGYTYRTYYEDRFISNFGRVEDIPVGWACNLTGGKNLGLNDNGTFDEYVLLDLTFAYRLGGRYYWAANISGNGFLKNDDLSGSEVTLRMGTTHHVKLPGRQTLVYRIHTSQGSNWDPRRKSFMDSPRGLRGYDIYSLAGSRTLWFNIEDRIMTPWRFWFFHFGPAFFYDGGLVWEEGEDPFKKRLHSSAGIGLRVENTKQQGAGITRFDLAYNFDRGIVAQLIITSGHLIKAHYGLNAYSPSLFIY